MANFVQLYKSTDVNAPVLTGQVNGLINVLGRCLVDGYTTASVTSITRSGATATATISTNATLVTGNYVTIAGANEADYNGTFQITVLSGTQFTYTVANSPATPATGTLLYNKAGLQWSRPFTSTNAAVYRSTDNTSNQFYLQVTDNATTAGGSKEAQLLGFEAMTAFGVGTRQFPTTTQFANGLSARKSTTADATARAWTLIGDDKTFYFTCQTGDTGTNHSFGFGHFISTRSGDGYNTFLAGETVFNSATSQQGISQYTNPANLLTANFSIVLARSYTQIAAPPTSGSLATYPGMNMSNNNAFSATTSGAATPNTVDNGYYFMSIFVVENLTTVSPWRGRMPGMYACAQTQPTGQYDQVTNIAGLTGVTLTSVLINQTGANNTVGNMFYDTFGPWT